MRLVVTRFRPRVEAPSVSAPRQPDRRPAATPSSQRSAPRSPQTRTSTPRRRRRGAAACGRGELADRAHPGRHPAGGQHRVPEPPATSAARQDRLAQPLIRLAQRAGIPSGLVSLSATFRAPRGGLPAGERALDRAAMGVIPRKATLEPPILPVHSSSRRRPPCQTRLSTPASEDEHLRSRHDDCGVAIAMARRDRTRASNQSATAPRPGRSRSLQSTPPRAVAPDDCFSHCDPRDHRVVGAAYAPRQSCHALAGGWISGKRGICPWRVGQLLLRDGEDGFVAPG